MRDRVNMGEMIRQLFINWPAKALALVGAILLYLMVNLNSMEERYISVPVELELPDNLVPAELYPGFARVYLRGRGEDIFAIEEDEIQVSADFSAYQNDGVFQVPLEYRRLGKAEGMEPLELRIEPSMLTLTLEEKAQAELPIVARISGSPAAGFELSSYSVIPDSITVSGPKSAVDNISELQTEIIDMNGHDEDFSLRVAVQQANPLLSFEGSRLVEFRAKIEDSILVNTFEDVPIVLLGLEPGLSASLAVESGSIRAQASQRMINQLDPDAISLAVDASDIDGPGEYSLSVRPVVPRGFVVFRFDPLEILVIVFDEDQIQEDDPSNELIEENR